MARHECSSYSIIQLLARQFAFGVGGIYWDSVFFVDPTSEVHGLTVLGAKRERRFSFRGLYHLSADRALEVALSHGSLHQYKDGNSLRESVQVRQGESHTEESNQELKVRRFDYILG